MERIYIDTCVWCRPFDEPTDKRIMRESTALHKILGLTDENEIEIVGSGVLLLEISMIDSFEKMDAVETLIQKSITDFARITKKVEELGEELIEACGLDAMDATHIALAIESGANSFLTTDDRILNRDKCISEFGIIVKNPTDYIKGESDG